MYLNTTLVTNALQREEIDKLRRRIKENHTSSGKLCVGEGELDLALTGSSSSKVSIGSSSCSYSRLLYVKVGLSVTLK